VGVGWPDSLSTTASNVPTLADNNGGVKTGKTQS
jgi:hypothetical protein